MPWGSMTVYPRCPGGVPWVDDYHWKTAILRRPKSYVLEGCN